MAYLIPKSARNVKLQLFKGLGLIEMVIIIIAIILGFIMFNYLPAGLVARIIIGVLMTIFTVVLVSPSFLVNKKGYQSFSVLLDYFTQRKDFKNKVKMVKKNG